MKGLFLNYRGLGGSEKRKYLRELIRDLKPEFLGIRETVKADFDDRFLQSIQGGTLFQWNWVLASGRSGGILFGIKDSEFDVVDICKGVYILKVDVFHKPSQSMWCFMTVYGDAQPSGKEAFLLELVTFCRNRTNLVVLVDGVLYLML